MGGKEKNKHRRQRQHVGGGGIGKLPVVGIKDRASNQVRATVVKHVDGDTLQDFVTEHTLVDTMVYTDGETGYIGLPCHAAVRHSVGEYVREQIHTNGIESFWSLLKRGYVGTYHKMSPQHLQRYVDEFAGRYNQRPFDTLTQMGAMLRGLELKRLR